MSAMHFNGFKGRTEQCFLKYHCHSECQSGGGNFYRCKYSCIYVSEFLFLCYL